LGVGGDIFATNRNADFNTWKTHAVSQAESQALTIMKSLTPEALFKAYGLYQDEDGKFYKGESYEENGTTKYRKTSKAEDQSEITSTGLGQIYFDSTYGSTTDS
jgi:hypothetical protein